MCRDPVGRGGRSDFMYGNYGPVFWGMVCPLRFEIHSLPSPWLFEVVVSCRPLVGGGFRFLPTVVGGWTRYVRYSKNARIDRVCCWGQAGLGDARAAGADCVGGKLDDSLSANTRRVHGDLLVEERLLFCHTLTYP